MLQRVPKIHPAPVVEFRAIGAIQLHIALQSTKTQQIPHLLLADAHQLVTVAVLTFIYGLVAVLLTHHLAERMRANPRIGRVLEKVAGVFLIGFGIKLAISK